MRPTEGDLKSIRYCARASRTGPAGLALFQENAERYVDQLLSEIDALSTDLMQAEDERDKSEAEADEAVARAEEAEEKVADLTKSLKAIRSSVVTLSEQLKGTGTHA